MKTRFPEDGSKRSSRHWTGYSARVALLAFTISVLVSGCKTTLRIQTAHVPPGSLRLAQVVQRGSESWIKGSNAKILHQALADSGITEEEIKDGSVVLARIECCGGPNEKSSAIMMYVPPGLDLHPGDIVELRAADPSKKAAVGQLNVVTRVIQIATDQNGPCRWDPPKDFLWGRTLYADWMPQEGWVHQGGLYKAWYKPGP
jgi:hypothetical protein